MNIQLEADCLFKMITVGTNLLGLVDGKEDLFGLVGKEMDKASPVIQVLKELSVGLVPVRGISRSHCVIEVDGKSLVVATDILAPGGELLASASELELVGFTEEGSYWRDLRRTLFSGQPIRHTRELRKASPPNGGARSSLRIFSRKPCQAWGTLSFPGFKSFRPGIPHIRISRRTHH